MKIEGWFTIKGRGEVVTMKIDAPVRRHRYLREREAGKLPENPDALLLRRLSDGRTWPVVGIERFCMHLDKPLLYVGEGVGILLRDAGDLAEGDDVALDEVARKAPPV